MMRTIILLLTAGLLATTPALAQVQLDSWDFNSKPELVERLEGVQQQIDNKLEEAETEGNSLMREDLRKAKENIDQAITNVRNADLVNWDATISDLEAGLNDDNLTDYDVYEDRYWDYP